MSNRAQGLPVALSSKRPSGNIMRENVVFESTLKLPIWPVYGGVIAQIFDWLGMPKLAKGLLKSVGGRVVPMQLAGSITGADPSPFLLLVHHSHSFIPLDPIRPITNLILPEGFPAHPHSGFGTLTFTLTGGLRHRDSEGVQMQYGDGDAQWMRAGRGVIHEEMWDVREDRFQRIEIFQLWIDIPQKMKRSEPLTTVMRAADIPVISIDQTGSVVRVLYGNVSTDGGDAFVCGPGNSISDSSMCIMHVTLSAAAQQHVVFPAGSSCVMYVQSGTLLLDDGSKRVEHNSLCSISSRREDVGRVSSVSLCSAEDGAEILVLIGQPLSQKAVMNGPFVGSDSAEDYTIQRSWRSVGQEAFWDYKLSDSEWRDHVSRLKLQERLSESNF